MLTFFSYSGIQKSRSAKTAPLTNFLSHFRLPSFLHSRLRHPLPPSCQICASFTKSYDSRYKHIWMCIWVPVRNNRSISFCSEISDMNIHDTFGSCEWILFWKHYARDFNTSCIDIKGYNKVLLLSIRNKVWDIEFSCMSIHSWTWAGDWILEWGSLSNNQAHKDMVIENNCNYSQGTLQQPYIHNYGFWVPFFQFKFRLSFCLVTFCLGYFCLYCRFWIACREIFLNLIEWSSRMSWFGFCVISRCCWGSGSWGF